MKALIAYGTRHGATTGTSEEIAKILREEGFDTKIVNLKEEKIPDIMGFMRKKISSPRELITVEVKAKPIKLMDIFQARLYQEILNRL